MYRDVMYSEECTEINAYRGIYIEGGTERNVESVFCHALSNVSVTTIIDFPLGEGQYGYCSIEQ